MSQGYKERCLETDNAIAMWSFDGDAYDRASHLPLNNFILDEVDNNSPAQIFHDSPTVESFTLGHPSLVELESSNQYSATFGGIGASAIPQVFPKSYLNIPHTSAFEFPEYGSFTVELLFKKIPEHEWFSYYDFNVKVCPIIRKAGVFTIFMWFRKDGQSELNPSIFNLASFIEVTGPLGTTTIPHTVIDSTAVPVHLVLVWNVRQITEYEYLGTQKIYANNRLLGEKSQVYWDTTFPTTNVTSPIEVGGSSDDLLTWINHNSISAGDRNGSDLYVDQISIYGYALDHNIVSIHYGKIFNYNNMIRNESPSFFWDMADINDGTDIIHADIGLNPGTLFGGFTKNVPGPPSLPTTTAIEFNQTSWAWFKNFKINSTDAIPMMDISGDYSVEFWFTASISNSGTLLSMRGFSENLDGWLIEINVHNNQIVPGAIQFTERRGVYCSAIGNYNDNQWHHLAITRRGQIISMYIDGSEEATTTSSVSTLEKPGQLMIFSDGPRSFAGIGRMCYLALYPYGLQEAQIAARGTYQVRYEIKGIVTLQGNPIKATLRFYYSNTGELIKEIESDLETGEYRIELFNNKNVDILVFDKYNKNVRYRAFGPIAPSGFEDLPITL